MRFAFTPPEKALLALLRLHLHTADASSVADGTFALSEPEWGAVYALACRQGVQAVTYDAVKTLPKDLMPPKALLLKWAIGTKQIVAENCRKREVLADLCHFCHANGFDPVLLKGLTLARCYPQPDLRESGDFDLWFPDREKESDALFATVVDDMNYGNKKHTTFVYDGVMVENHQTLLDQGESRPAVNRLIEERLRTYWRDETPVSFALPQGESVLMPSSQFLLLLMARHQTAHLSYTITLRHIIDWGLLVEKSDSRDIQSVLEGVDGPLLIAGIRLITLVAQSVFGLAGDAMGGFTASEKRRARRLLLYLFRPVSLRGYRRGTLRYYPKALRCLWRTSWFNKLGTGEGRIHFLIPFFVNKLNRNR